MTQFNFDTNGTPYKDADIRAHCEGKENCQRQHLLRYPGDIEHLHQDRSKCCGICTPCIVVSKIGTNDKKRSSKHKQTESHEAAPCEMMQKCLQKDWSRQGIVF